MGQGHRVGVFTERDAITPGQAVHRIGIIGFVGKLAEQIKHIRLTDVLASQVNDAANGIRLAGQVPQVQIDFSFVEPVKRRVLQGVNRSGLADRREHRFEGSNRDRFRIQLMLKRLSRRVPGVIPWVGRIDGRLAGRLGKRRRDHRAEWMTPRVGCAFFASPQPGADGPPTIAPDGLAS